MNGISVLFALTLSLALNGCTMMQGTATVFHGDNHAARGSVDVLPINAEQSGSLGFKAAKQLLMDALLEKGYKPNSAGKSPDFSAFMTYGIGNGRTSESVVPIYGQTGGGTSFSSGYLTTPSGTYNYSGTTNTMPHYGMVGAVPISQTSYDRELNIDIFNNSKPNDKAYEIRVKSTGSCGDINAVLPYLIQGAFQSFPGQSGKTESVVIKLPSKFSC